MFLYVYLESEIYNTKTILLDFKKKRQIDIIHVEGYVKSLSFDYR